MVGLSQSTLVRAVRLRFDRGEAVRQAFESGNRSLVFLLVTMSFLGMIMVFQTCRQAERILGDYSLVGAAFLQLLARELAPTIGAILITTRVGAGIAAELGSMAATEQIDALRVSGADVISELVAPRAAACLFMVPALIVIGGAAAEVAGMITAKIGFAVTYDVFF